VSSGYVSTVGVSVSTRLDDRASLYQDIVLPYHIDQPESLRDSEQNRYPMLFGRSEFVRME
jgi:hypothetical protein